MSDDRTCVQDTQIPSISNQPKKKKKHKKNKNKQNPTNHLAIGFATAEND